ncbi:MAG TPA: hypothetical protein VH165_09185, partial [Kofleriaceae bacterium]|nr:hypothetical protein [Kofleriaceae bacterium]
MRGRAVADAARAARRVRITGVAILGVGLALAALARTPASAATDPSSGTATGVERGPAATPPAPPGSPAWAETADVTEHLGARLPRDLVFADAQGQRVMLGSLFDGEHPVLLVLAYYECPQLCSLVIDSAVAAMQALDHQGWQLGRQYRVATISFDATERIDQAARKQASVLAMLGSGGSSRVGGDGGSGGSSRVGGRGAADWPFWVGGEASVRALTGALGFQFLRDPRTGALAHPAVSFVLTPDGTIARYLYGTDYPARDLKLA